MKPDVFKHFSLFKNNLYIHICKYKDYPSEDEFELLEKTIIDYAYNKLHTLHFWKCVASNGQMIQQYLTWNK
mgnify:CR=1 FL=1